MTVFATRRAALISVAASLSAPSWAQTTWPQRPIRQELRLAAPEIVRIARALRRAAARHRRDVHVVMRLCSAASTCARLRFVGGRMFDVQGVWSLC